MTSVLRYHCSH